MKLNFSLLVLMILPQLAFTENDVLPLWPGDVPGQQEAKAPPVVEKPRGGVTRVSRVTDPVLVVYEANPEKNTGVGVIVCPGGGYQILALDKEGEEVAMWLSEQGVTAFVLQYRVPANPKGALQDVQRAMRVVRSMAETWGVKRLGLVGFSAGGSLSARLSTRYAESLYPSVDEHDALSARPDFAGLIYPAYLDRGEQGTLTPELKLSPEVPPLFLFATLDDHKYVNSSLVLGAALREQGLPYELHVLPKGGHGFGMRPGKRAAETWPTLFLQWVMDH